MRRVRFSFLAAGALVAAAAACNSLLNFDQFDFSNPDAGATDGATVVLGSVFGALALGKKSDLSDACSNGHCPASAKDDFDSGKTFGTVSTVGFIVGGVGLVAGVYLYLTEGPKSSSAAIVGPQSVRIAF